jgi:hypothetical protein
MCSAHSSSTVDFYAQDGHISGLLDVILEWAAQEPSPFEDAHAPSNHASGYLSTGEVFERLRALVQCGDFECDLSFSEDDVGNVLHTLYNGQQSQLQPSIGMLSRQRMGIGRLWRIIPPPAGDEIDGAATQSANAATPILHALVNAEDATTRAQHVDQLLEAVGEIGSLRAVVEAIAAAAAPLPGSPIDFQLLLTAAHDALNEAEDVALQRLAGSDRVTLFVTRPRRQRPHAAEALAPASDAREAMRHAQPAPVRWRERFLVWLLDGGASLRASLS